ncbi:DUF4174 domain-containing protein [Roseovarius aestuariivivens]|uniref:DUF4174 domain-containing protein n=1 Tax=Roseovarius aestuariivivens TaxID=1888910 RepID=UPI001081CD0E|nr:DUF4174 domain-containing protein [Roseovarius aestuariivivens]
MRSLVRISALFCLAAAGLGGGAAAGDFLFRPLGADETALSPYRWKNRPLVLFAPSPDDPTYRAAMAKLAASEPDLRERDIVVLSDTAPDEKGALRQRLAPQSFLMLLVGKDGGIKLRSDSVIPVDTLRRTIDAMPMRQREMRQD